MIVCDKCSSLGEVKEVARKPKASNTKNSPGSSGKTSASRKSKPEKVLKRDYGSLVREAREDEDLKMEELARKISEKESVVRRIENKDLKPNTELSKKLERELDINLYTDYEEAQVSTDSDDESLTIGDVVDIK